MMFRFPIQIRQPEDINIAIFHVLSLCRHHSIGNIDSFRKAIICSGISFPYRSAFWLRLCLSLKLITHSCESKFLVSGSVSKWWGYDIRQQWQKVLNAWISMPKGQNARKARSKIIQAIERIPKNPQLTTKEKSLSYSLEAFGFWNPDFGEELRGRIFNCSHYENNMDDCVIEEWGNEFRFLPPFNFGLIWEWEKYFSPVRPFTYSHKMIQERFLPKESREFFESLMRTNFKSSDKGNKIHGAIISNDVVVQFNSIESVRIFRKESGLRKKLKNPISNRAFRVPYEEKERFIRMLIRRNVCIDDQCNSIEKNDSSGDLLTQKEFELLLNIVLLAEEYHVIKVPPMLKYKLARNLPLEQRTAKMSQKHAKYFTVNQNFRNEEECKVINCDEVLRWLEAAIKQESSVEFNYHVPDRERPELRYVSPLVVEKRGIWHYLIAYDHNRRANRTFRLDRIVKVFD